MAGNTEKITLTTGEGTLSFPNLFKPEVNKQSGKEEYSVQFIIPKTERETIRAIMAAIKKTAEAKWGANWKQIARNPLRDGDREKGNIGEDGKTYEEKYPERLGAVFFNAKSQRPVGIYDRTRNVITDESEIYSGAKGKVAIEFYTYTKQGNSGVGIGLNGVQKIGNGEQIGGGGKPSVESMFDLLDDEDDLGLDDEFEIEEDEVEEEPEEKPARRAPAKKTAAKKAPAKKAAPAKRKVEEIEVEEDEDDLMDEFDDLDED